MASVSSILQEIDREVERQKALAFNGSTEEFDKGNSKNDWIAYLNAYSGRAAAKVFKNDKQGEDFRPNMVKVAALAVSAIASHDEGFC